MRTSHLPALLLLLLAACSGGDKPTVSRPANGETQAELDKRCGRLGSPDSVDMAKQFACDSTEWANSHHGTQPSIPQAGNLNTPFVPETTVTNVTVDTVTTYRTDSTPHSDSMAFTRVRRDSVTTIVGTRVAEILETPDSSWWRYPPPVLPSSSLTGTAYGPYHMAVDSVCKRTLNYSATTLILDAATFATSLAKARSCGGRIYGLLARTKTMGPNTAGMTTGKLSIAAITNYLGTLPDTSQVCPYVADGTLLGIAVTDDIAGANLWGGENPPLARVDSGALAITQKYPCANATVTFVRALPTQLTRQSALTENYPDSVTKVPAYTWRWLDAAVFQYNAAFRHGWPAHFDSIQVAQAKVLKLGAVASVNYLSGGCGPPTLQTYSWTSAQAGGPAKGRTLNADEKCPPGVTGTGLASTFGPYDSDSLRRWQMSAAEVLDDGKTFLADPYVCASINWQWGPVYLPSDTRAWVQSLRDFQVRADNRAAIESVGVLARNRPPTSCKQR